MSEPQRIDQTTFGIPGGNCFTACLAMLLHKPIEAVPYFMDPDIGDWLVQINDWLAPMRLWAVCVRAENLRPPGFTIMSGQSPRAPNDPEQLHSVVARGGEVWHDPHPSRHGLLTIVDHVLLIPWELGLQVSA